MIELDVHAATLLAKIQLLEEDVIVLVFRMFDSEIRLLYDNKSQIFDVFDVERLEMLFHACSQMSMIALDAHVAVLLPKFQLLIASELA
jgi:hypothetical protein